MSFLATPYIITGGLSLYLSYKTYNSYYNKPFEYIEIEDLNLQENEKSLEIETHTDENEKVNSDKGCKEDMDDNGNTDTDLGKFDTVDDLVSPDSSNNDENLSKAKNKYIDNIIKEDVSINEVSVKDLAFKEGDKLEFKKSMECKLETIVEENEEEVKREQESDTGVVLEKGNISSNMAKKIINEVVEEVSADKVSEKKRELVVDKSDLESNVLLNRYNNKGVRKRKKNKKNKRK